MKSGCVQLPKWVRETLALFKEFASALFWCALGVTALSLILVGIAALFGSLEVFLEDYTPLLLGLFSIAITLYLFQRNVNEGRERAKQERDQAVRPVLTLTVVDQLAPMKDRIAFEMVYPKTTDKEIVQQEIWLEVENIGAGPALDIQIIAFVNFEYFKVGGSLDVLRVDNKQFIRLHLLIPVDSIERMYTVFCDVYGNNHVCSHYLVDHEVNDSEFIMNHYVSEDYPDRERLIEIWGNNNPCSFKYVKRGLAE